MSHTVGSAFLMASHAYSGARPLVTSVTRLTRLFLTTSLCALTAAALTGCASRREAPDGAGAARHISIKDSAADHRLPTTAQPSRLHKVAMPAADLTPAPKAPAVSMILAEPAKPMRPVDDRASQLPTKVATLPPVEPKPAPKSAAIVETATPNAAPAEPKPPVPVAVTNEVVPPASKTPIIIRPADGSTPSKPPAANAPADARPVTEGRRVAANAEPAAPAKQPSVVPPPTEPPTTTDAKPAATTVTPPTVAVQPVAPPAVAAASSSPLASKAEPKAAPLVDSQRVTATLASADAYMRAGRYQNARTLLDDSAKGGHPEILQALGETYDPLVLPEMYPKLSRIGDAPRAIFYYEQAKAKGAKDLDQRLNALKTLAGQKSP